MIPVVFICDSIRTPFGRYGGRLAQVRADDLAAIPIRSLIERSPTVDWGAVDDVILGCANQAGEDNRNVARMAALLAGLPETVPAVTINRLCGSSLEAAAMGARMIIAGEADLLIVGGVESMSRAPFVFGKSANAFDRSIQSFDTTIGWRFINPLMQQRYGVDSMPETAENVAENFKVSRDDQDAFAHRSQQKWAVAQNRSFFAKEIVPVAITEPKGGTTSFSVDEHPRPGTSREALSRLKPVTKSDGTVTAGNASGINDGSAALVLASREAVVRHGLNPRARILGSTSVGIAPRIMGFGPAPASQKLLKKLGHSISAIDVLELNEAFAAQALAVLRQLGIPDDAPHVNPNGGAIAIGHPLGASGARLIGTAVNQLEDMRGHLALCTMCVGVGQGIALMLARD